MTWGEFLLLRHDSLEWAATVAEHETAAAARVTEDSQGRLKWPDPEVLERLPIID